VSSERVVNKLYEQFYEYASRERVMQGRREQIFLAKTVE
jgi:hypothetical protein